MLTKTADENVYVWRLRVVQCSIDKPDIFRALRELISRLNSRTLRAVNVLGLLVSNNNNIKNGISDLYSVLQISRASFGVKRVH